MAHAKFFAAMRTSLFGGHLSTNQANSIEAILTEWEAKLKSELFGCRPSCDFPEIFHGSAGQHLCPTATAHREPCLRKSNGQSG